MMYILTECKLPETLLSGASHKRFQTMLAKATAAGIAWSYSFSDNRLEITNAPNGLEEKLAAYGKVEVRADATFSGL